MNAARRKALATLRGKIEEVKSLLEEELSGEAESLHDEEQDFAVNMPENLQSSEKHDTAEEKANNIESAKDSIGEAVSALESAINSLEEAAE